MADRPLLETVVTAFLTPARPALREGAGASPSPDRMIPTRRGAIALWERGEGPAVLLVHGWSGTHADLHGFVEPLVGAGFRVISIDLPSHGQSEGKTASIPDLADGLTDVQAVIGPLTGIIAHSVGCAAAGVAMKAGLVSDRVVLVAPPLRYADYIRAFARQAGVDGDAMLNALRNKDVDVDRVDFESIAPAMTSEALVIHSRDDKVVPFANGSAVAAAWPGSRLMACDGLGHGRILGDPKVIETAVSFFLR